MGCELTQSVLHGYLDGELDAARAADFERHLVSCPECVAALEAQETLRSSIQRAGLYERAPGRVRHKVSAEFGQAALVAPIAQITPIKASPRASAWRWLAVAAAFVLAASLGWRMFPGGRGENAYASEIVDAHLRSLQPGHHMDVVSTDQHTVKPWFDGKLDFAPPVVDLASEGFPLQGGRLDVIRGRSVSVLVYGRRKHVIDVFVWPTTERDSPPEFGSKLGYQWVDWRKGGMELCVVSDVNTSDLSELQHLLSK